MCKLYKSCFMPISFMLCGLFFMIEIFLLEFHTIDVITSFPKIVPIHAGICSAMSFLVGCLLFQNQKLKKKARSSINLLSEPM